MEGLKILVSAYACSPKRGSEPGMGWNFVCGLSAYHEVHVIVEKRKWEKPISEFLKNNPESNSKLKFYFIDKSRNKWLRKLWPPSYYWFYKTWQKKAYSLVKQLDARENFDIIHQLNMVGYREPGYLYKLKKPFVWGPIGGLENSPWQFLPTLGLKGFVFYAARNLINYWQRNFSRRPRLAASHPKSKLIAATPANAKLIKQLWGKDSAIICEVGKENTVSLKLTTRAESTPLKIVWSGLHTTRKNLPLLLKALALVNFNFELHILGTGAETKKWQGLAEKYGLNGCCKWYGWLEREDAIQVMQNGHVFCITSISDLTSTVTLEALSYGLPIICLDHCGFAHVVTEECGVKIPVSSPKQAAKDFAEALELINKDENYRQNLIKGAVKRAQQFSWESKVIHLNTIYNSLIE